MDHSLNTCGFPYACLSFQQNPVRREYRPFSWLKQLDPKSMTFIFDIAGCCSRMFSGFKSQCITCSFRKNRNVCSSWLAKLFITIRLMPCTFQLEIIALDELVERDVMEGKGDAEMAAEIERLIDCYDVSAGRFLFSFISQMLQNFDFYKSLLVESPLIANHLYSSQHLVLVVTALENLSETSLPQYSQHLVPVRKLIVVHHIVVTSLIIIAKIAVARGNGRLDLLTFKPKKVDLRVRKNFPLLKLAQMLPTRP